MQLVYPGKKNIGEIEKLIGHLRTSANPMPPAPSGALIHGDNLPVMARMLEHYSGKFDLIYIDPPFNTQTDFYFSPKHVAHVSHSLNSLLAYSDKMEINQYLEFMRERLFVIRQLLSSSGTLYLHIDSKVGHYLKIILDEIFGPQSFLNEISRVKSNPKNFRRKAYGNQKDVIYVYAVKPGQQIFNDIKDRQNDLLRLYPKTDASGRQYATVPCHAPGQTANGPTGALWRGQLPPPGRHWRKSPECLDELDRQGLIEWSRNNVPRIKKYADQWEGKKIQDIWLDFKDPPYPVYPTEKNMDMLELIVRQSSKPDSMLLDCFCGSGAFLAAALRHGRLPVGIDCSEIAINTAKQRPELARIACIAEAS